ncbi:pre-mRNA-splicing factor prp46 [Coemansia sp. RSA 1591]|nr:pre-mRNA-splicing factor prp46 [Coemansia sp. RSA 1591]
MAPAHTDGEDASHDHLQPLVQSTVRATHSLFSGTSVPTQTDALLSSQRQKIFSKYRAEYLSSRVLPRSMQPTDSPNPLLLTAPRQTKLLTQNGRAEITVCSLTNVEDEVQKVLDGLAGRQRAQAKKHKVPTRELVRMAAEATRDDSAPAGQQIVRKRTYEPVRPEWHAPWKLMRVISGHIGWVRALAVEPGNRWFASGSVDRTIKIWDLASGTLRLTLTGHVSPVRGLAVSSRHPYLFSAGEDKQVKCWDLETNKVVRQYHGHLSGIYALALHPTLDVLVTAGRDSVARVWDIRTKQQVHVLAGHRGTIASVVCQDADPQVITGSMDSTVRLWDLAAGKSMATLTHHKKAVRALALHPSDFGFASASSDSIRQWKCPRGDFVQSFNGHSSIVNTMCANNDGVMFSGGDDGTMRFWDWRSAHCFQKTQTVVQPGSLDSEAGVFCSTFDRTGFRLITGEADKSIKIWKEDEEATEESHPVDFRPSLGRRRY